MKVRNGFVSNSSSSSFMIAIGVINNWEKFSKWYDEVKSSLSYQSDLIIVDPIVASLDDYSEVSKTRDGWSVVAPINDETTVHISEYSLNDADSNVPEDVKAKSMLLGHGDKRVVIYNIGNDEGDSAFYSNDESDEINYDIDLDWFSDNQRKIYTEFGPENGIAHVDKIFGAGRNG